MLSTGAEIVSEMDENYNLTNPARIIISQQGVAMMPLCPFANSDKIKVNPNHVIFEANIEDEIKNAYNSKFGSGLVLPQSGIVMG